MDKKLNGNFQKLRNNRFQCVVAYAKSISKISLKKKFQNFLQDFSPLLTPVVNAEPPSISKTSKNSKLATSNRNSIRWQILKSYIQVGENSTVKLLKRLLLLKF